MNMKKKILALALVVICLSSLAYGTLAYFTSKDVAHNVITSGDIQIALLEWKDEDKTEAFPQKEGISGVVPGTAVTKIVEVKNTCQNDAFVRIKVTKAIELAKGVPGEANLDYVKINFDTDYWTLKNGYYYYKEALPAGATTKPLFTKVTFDPRMDNMYQNSKATVTVKAYAVQAANNGDDPLTAAGWPTK